MKRKWFVRLAIVAFPIVLAFSALAAQQMQKMEDKPLPPNVEKQLNEVRQNLNQVKTQLPDLNCCNDPACNYCPLVAGKCPCGMNVKTEVGVCGECRNGWAANNGRIPGVNPQEVGPLNPEMNAMMEKARVMHFPKGQKQQPAATGDAAAELHDHQHHHHGEGHQH